jgi:sugar phosphate isomerase/epimerase
MFPISYNTNGLRDISLEAAVAAIAGAGYDGVELSCHSAHLHPLRATPAEIAAVRALFERQRLPVVCVATGADDLLGSTRFEPSFITADAEGRVLRARLTRKAIEIARSLDCPIVNFSSGIRKEGVGPEAARNFLLDGVRRCLDGSPEEVTLAIEPEPGFFVETIDGALDLINEVGSPRFRLNIDVGHARVTETDFLGSLERGIPFTRHVHIEDIKGQVHRHEIPGDGDIDFREVFRTFLAGGYRGYLSVELYLHAERKQQALTRSRSHLNQEFEALALQNA